MKPILLLGIWCATVGFTVRLHDAEVVSGDVTLGEIARIEEVAAEDLRARIESIEVARAIPAGGRRTVSLETLRMRILAEGFARTDLSFAGPSEIAIVRRGQTIAPERVEAAVREALASRVAEGDRVSIGRIPPRFPTFPEGEVEITAEPQGANVAVTVQAGEMTHRLAVGFQIRRMRPVAVATRRIERGEVAAADAIRFESKEIGGVRDPILSFEEIRGLSARQPILEGVVLASRFFERPALVRSGEPVVLRARAGGVVVSVRGEAKQDGRLGDSVRIVSGGSDRMLTGRVTGRGEVTVLE